jgi:hypothetical protein
VTSSAVVPAIPASAPDDRDRRPLPAPRNMPSPPRDRRNEPAFLGPRAGRRRRRAPRRRRATAAATTATRARSSDCATTRRRGEQHGAALEAAPSLTSPPLRGARANSSSVPVLQPSTALLMGPPAPVVDRVWGSRDQGAITGHAGDLGRRGRRHRPGRPADLEIVPIDARGGHRSTDHQQHGRSLLRRQG